MAKRQKSPGKAGSGGTSARRDLSEADLVLALKRWDVVSKLGITGLVGLTVVGAVYFGVYCPIEASHGEATAIQFVLSWIADLKLNVALAWGTALACSAWAVRERRKRLRERRERDERIVKLERQIDPNRTSSQLTTEGTQSHEGGQNG